MVCYSRRQASLFCFAASEKQRESSFIIEVDGKLIIERREAHDCTCPYRDHNKESKSGVVLTETVAEVVHRHGHCRMVNEMTGWTYIGCVNHGKMDGWGVSKMGGVIYTGQWKNGKRHGLGVYETEDGLVIFDGGWKDDKEHGKASYIQFNLDGSICCTFKGTFRNGREHGSGTYTWGGGSTYDGEWRDGMQHGHGTYEFKNGVITTTYATHDSRKPSSAIAHSELAPPRVALSHFCSAETPSGETRVTYGTFQTNHRKEISYSTCLEASSILTEWTYVGEYEYGLEHGYGVCKKGDGSSYEGTYHLGKKHGQGRSVYAQQGVYEGEYKHGKEDGPGSFICTDKSKYEGMWEKGQKHGVGKFNCVNHYEYDGEWALGLFHGHGAITYSDGRTYSGQWENGMKQGYGVATYTNGCHYSGEWYQSYKHGRGLVTYSDGKNEEGEWRHDVEIEGMNVQNLPKVVSHARKVLVARRAARSKPTPQVRVTSNAVALAALMASKLMASVESNKEPKKQTKSKRKKANKKRMSRKSSGECTDDDHASEERTNNSDSGTKNIFSHAEDPTSIGNTGNEDKKPDWFKCYFEDVS